MDKFVKLGLVAVMLVAVTSVASAGLVFQLSYVERDDASGNPPSEEQFSDLWTLTVSEPNGLTGKTVLLDSITIDLTENANGVGGQYGRKYFDIPDDDKGFDPDFGGFVPDSALANLIVGSAFSGSDGYNSVLSIDFGGQEFGVGTYTFTADVDNTDAIVWGATLAEIGAHFTVTYNNGLKETGYFAPSDPNLPHDPQAYANVTVAPLPGSLLLCGIGLGFMGVVRRFRKK